jgi:outer membrane protein TolC
VAPLLALRQPLDFAQRWAKWRRARAEADALEAQRLAAAAGIGFELERAYHDAREARARLKASEKGMRTAQGWLAAVKQNIDIGTADSRDLVEAARAYYELRLRFYQAIHDLNVAIAGLRKASGLPVAG